MSERTEATVVAAAGPASGHPPTSRRWPTRMIAGSTVAAWLAIACIGAGTVVGVVPVDNPGVQRCGAPLVFVLTARADVYADPNDPPGGLTPRQAEQANDERCRERVARRAVPAGALILAGLLIGLAGLVTLFVGRSARRRDLTSGLPTPP